MIALCVRLGFWQLGRLEDRRARNAVIAAQRARPPVRLPGPLVRAESLAERRLEARGVYDPARSRLWHPRMHQGVPGAGLLTPLRMANGTAILVDRGWRAVQTRAAALAIRAPTPDTMVTVSGYGRAAPRGPGDVDPRAVDDSLPYPLLPVVLQPASDEAPAPGGLVLVPPPALHDGPHRSYAMQWFSFATIVLVGTILLLRREQTGR